MCTRVAEQMQSTKFLSVLMCQILASSRTLMSSSEIVMSKDNGPFLMMPVIRLLKDVAFVLIVTQLDLFHSGDATEEQGS